jgi:hypothetical protein
MGLHHVTAAQATRWPGGCGRGPDQIEYREPTVIAHNASTGEREAVCEIMATGSSSGLWAFPMSQDAETVVLDFVQPAGSGRRLLGDAGQAGLKTGLRATGDGVHSWPTLRLK